MKNDFAFIVVMAGEYQGSEYFGQGETAAAALANARYNGCPRLVVAVETQPELAERLDDAEGHGYPWEIVDGVAQIDAEVVEAMYCRRAKARVAQSAEVV